VVTPGVPRPPVLKALTSIRFFAALHVALYHFVRPFSLWGVLAGAMMSGYTGVSFFFVLSGFVLTYAHAPEYERGRRDYKKFLVARFARIYPVYLLAMLVALALHLDSLWQKNHWIAYLADLVMLQSWNMRMVNFFHAGAWTLSCEEFFYLIFPLVLMPLLPKTRAAALGWTAGFFALALAAPLYCLVRYPIPAFYEEYHSATPINPGPVFLISRLPVFAVPEFLAGIALGWLFLKFRPSQKAGAQMAYAGAALFVAAMLFAKHLPYLLLHNGLLIPIYGLLLVGLSQPNWLTRMLSVSWLVLLGEASFSLYLFHQLLITATERFGVQMTFSQAVWRLALVIPFTVALHVYFERPARRAVLAWWARRHPAEMKVVA
jgi:peptidoglycan/LPS O-acetylase OafA/YrhL